MTKIVISILIAIAASVPAVALPADPLVVIRGQRLITDLRSVRQFLYADDANAERSAGAVLDALFSERFGDDVSFDSVLGQIGDVPYLFVVDQRDGKHVWGLLVPSSSSTRELSQTLLDHHRMQRGNPVIRERCDPRSAF